MADMNSKPLYAVLLVAVVLIIALGNISCSPEAPPPEEAPLAPPTQKEAPPPSVDEPYYGGDGVIAIIKHQLPDVVQRYTIIRNGELVYKEKMTAVDLRAIGMWDSVYLGRGKWQVTCTVNFINWFDYKKPMDALGTLTWNFYEKSDTCEYIGYRETIYGESELPPELEIDDSSVPTTTPTPTPTPIVKLRRGQYLIAQNGTYLGTLDSGFASESIFNDFGNYGSQFSSTSIWNTFSEYDSEFSSLSAFSDLASKPPMLFDGNDFICYITTNALKMPRVSPYSLIAFAESMGWE
jgi:hypothetical protein